MYEMYPDTWQVAADRHPDAAGKPRRRARKEHSVVPAVLVEQPPAGRPARLGA
jgi:hypothetical protein